MIEQHENQLLLSFPTPETARAFAQFLTTLVNLRGPETSEPLSGPSPALESSGAVQPPSPIPDSLEHARSRHTVLTEERQAQLAAQREQGLTAHQRQLRAQTTLRDGVLPFKQLDQAPPPSSQPSPRQRAQQEGGFADGELKVLRSPDPQPALRPAVPVDGGGRPEAERKKRSQLKPVALKEPSSQ